jgi:hypothetical protein
VRVRLSTSEMHKSTTSSDDQSLWCLWLKSNRSATGTRKRRAILSNVSNEGAFLPRSTRLRKSTEISSISANRSLGHPTSEPNLAEMLPKFLT